MTDKKKKKSNEQLVAEYQQANTPEDKKKIAEELYKKVFRLVVKNAGQMPNVCYGTQEDLIQEASLIFMRCLNKFDPTKKFKFSTYYGDACKYELRRYKDKQMKHVDNSYFLEIDEILTSKPEDIDWGIDYYKNLERIQNTLLKLNREQKITDKQFNTIIEEHGFFGREKKTRKQIAEERNCSLQNVGFLYRKAINKIKEEFANEKYKK
jgi:RNA polymerase sigma factor (sigma-70 family)